MTTTNELKELLNAIRELEKTTSVEFANVNNKLEQLHQDKLELKKNIESFWVVLNEPKDGLYIRINDIVHDIKVLSDEQTELKEIINNLKEKVNEFETIKTHLVKISGDRLENLDSTIKISKNSKKILWVFISSVGMILWEKISELVQNLF